MPANEAQSALGKDTEPQSTKRPYSKLRWTLIGLFVVVTVLLDASTNPILLAVNPIIYAFLIFVIAGLHSAERYGLKNTVVLFIITWLVSLFFEALSIQTGFPFGFYHYTIPSAIYIFQVPLIIIFGYFGTGYFSWALSHVLTGQYNKRLEGKWIFVVPFIAAFLMVMWDLGIDPTSSTVLSEWVWQTPGAYFGVPISNFVGWFMVVFIFFFLFALFLSKYDRVGPQKAAMLTSKLYWLEAAVMYGVVGVGTILIPLSINNDITQSMALVTMFTMIFVAVISSITIMNNKELC
ncbi:MAG: carotenoid biosynthesis protein [Halobacteriota archaeon]